MIRRLNGTIFPVVKHYIWTLQRKTGSQDDARKDYSINFEWKSNHKVGGTHSSLENYLHNLPVSPMGWALFQPHRDGDLSPGHPLILRVRHLPAWRRQGGVCFLEEMDRRQLHLALHWSHGKLTTLIGFSFIIRNSAEILDLVRPGHLPQQVQRHQDWTRGQQTWVQRCHLVGQK